MFLCLVAHFQDFNRSPCLFLMRGVNGALVERLYTSADGWQVADMFLPAVWRSALIQKKFCLMSYVQIATSIVFKCDMK